MRKTEQIYAVVMIGGGNAGCTDASTSYVPGATG